MNDKQFREAALAHARAHPEDILPEPHGEVQRCGTGAFVTLSVFVEDSEISLAPRIAFVAD